MKISSHIATRSVYGILGRPETAATGGLDRDQIARGEVDGRLRGELRAVEEIPSWGAGLAASGALRRTASSFAQQGEPARRERPQRAHDAVASAEAAPAARAEPQGVPLDPQRVGELECL